MKIPTLLMICDSLTMTEDIKIEVTVIQLTFYFYCFHFNIRNNLVGAFK